MPDQQPPAPITEAPEQPSTSPPSVVKPAIGDRPKRKLTMRQQNLIRYLTDPASPAYGVKTRAALLAGYAHSSQAFETLALPTVQVEIERQLAEVNATSKVRFGVLAQLLHKEHSVTEQQDGTGKTVSRTVTDNDKVRLMAARELGKLDGSYQRAGLQAHAQKRVVDAALDTWTRRLRASLRSPVPLDAPTDAQDASGHGSVPTDAEYMGDEPTGTGSTLAGEGEPGAGGTQEAGGGGGLGGVRV